MAAVLLAISSLIVSLNDCPGHPELRCVSARFNSPRLSEDEVAQVRHLVIATQTAIVVVNCSTTQFFSHLPQPSISFDNTRQFIPIQTAHLDSGNCVSGLPYLGLGLLSRSWNNFVISSNTVIMNPTSEIRICNSDTGFPDTYARSLSDRAWSVVSEIKINGNNSTESYELRIDSSSKQTWIHEEKYRELIQAISAEGFHVESTPRVDLVYYETFVRDCRSNLDWESLLPIVTFTIYDGVDYTLVTELQIFPNDYLTADCRLNIRPMIPGQIIGSIGDNVLRNLAIHFRAQSRTIGFCDPID